MVQLEALLPLLLEGSENIANQQGLLHPAELIQQLSDAHIHSALDLLLTKEKNVPLTVLKTLKAFQIKDKIADFLAAEGRSANELYIEAHPHITPEAAYTATSATTSNLTSVGDGVRDEIVCTTGVPAFDKALGGGWRDEVVEIVGDHGAGKTFFVLHTVLRHLSEHPDEYALWLDTTSTFSAEVGGQILESLQSDKVASSSKMPGVQLNDSDGANKNALDRLIVAKTFDLASAIQAIQQVRKDTYDTDTSPKIETKASEYSNADMADDVKDYDMLERTSHLPSDARFTSVVPETAGPAEVELLSSPPQSRQEHPVPPKQDSEQPKTNASSADVEPRTRHLRFIIVDNIAALLKGVLSATSAEGHARMMSFMRLLHALAKHPGTHVGDTQQEQQQQSIQAERKIATCFVINSLVPLSATANSTAAFHSVFPALDAKRVKAALGPTFTYLTDWTIYLSDAVEALPHPSGIAPSTTGRNEKQNQNDIAGKRTVFEIVRSRRMPQSRWAVYTQTDSEITATQ